MKGFLKGFRIFGSIINIIAVAALVVMVGVTLADIFIRGLGDVFISIARSAKSAGVAEGANRLSHVFNPITGAVEITRMMMVCMTPSFVSALINNRHVSVGLFVDRLPRKGQLAFDTVCYLASAAICGIMCYRGFIDMQNKINQRQVYTMLEIPTWPFYLVFAISMGFFAIAIVIKLIEKYWDKTQCQPVVDQAAAAAAAEGAIEEVQSIES